MSAAPFSSVHAAACAAYELAALLKGASVLYEHVKTHPSRASDALSVLLPEIEDKAGALAHRLDILDLAHGLQNAEARPKPWEFTGEGEPE